ncbi:MAG: hypothetical protein V4757_14890 [Pseudomonadota bacterium]
MKTFARLWLRSFLWIAVGPAVLCFIFGIIPGGQIIALILLFALCLPGALLSGPPHFSSEFGIAMTFPGVVFAIGALLLVSGFIAGALRVTSHLVELGLAAWWLKIDRRQVDRQLPHKDS